MLHQTPMQTIMPQAAHWAREICAISSIFEICNDVGCSYEERTWKQPAKPPAEAARLPAAIEAVNEVLPIEKGCWQTWSSYLFTVRAIGEFYRGDNEAACASLLEAQGCIDRAVTSDRYYADRRRYDGSCSHDVSYQYLWIRARLADLFEVTQNWAALEEQLRSLMAAAHDKPRRVFNAMFCITDDGDANDTNWGGRYELTRRDNPLLSLYRQLANACTHLGKHEEAAELLARAGSH